MKLSVILEGYGSVVNMAYGKAKNDPKPRVLLLGRWRHPESRNILVAGINLNYLDDDQVLRLRQSLPDILKPANLKSRYWRGKKLLPDIFDNSYRTYDQDYISAVTRDTLKFYKPTDDMGPDEPTKPTAPKAPPAAPAAATAPAAPAPAAPAPAAPAAPAPAAPAVAPAPAAPAPAAPTPAALAPTSPQKSKEVSPEPQKIKTSPKPEATPKGSQKADATLKPKVEKTPIKGPVEPKGPKIPPDKQKGITSAQRRQKKAEAIKKAVDAQQQINPVKPETPEEIKGVMGLFKKKE